MCAKEIPSALPSVRKAGGAHLCAWAMLTSTHNNKYSDVNRSSNNQGLLVCGAARVVRAKKGICVVALFEWHLPESPSIRSTPLTLINLLFIQNSLFSLPFHTHTHTLLSLFSSFPLYSSTKNDAQHTTILPSLLNLSYPKKTQQKKKQPCTPRPYLSPSTNTTTTTQATHRHRPWERQVPFYPSLLLTGSTQPSIVFIHAHHHH